jgi:hypothetical protein
MAMPASPAARATQPGSTGRKTAHAIPGETRLPWPRSASTATLFRRVPIAISLIAKSQTAAEMAGASLLSLPETAPQPAFPRPAPSPTPIGQTCSHRSDAIEPESRHDQISVTNPRKSPSSANARHRRPAQTTLCESGIRRFAASTPPERGAFIAVPRI